jgi:hypothetical protein
MAQQLILKRMSKKELGLLRELVPGAARVTVLVNPANAMNAETTLRETQKPLPTGSTTSTYTGGPLPRGAAIPFGNSALVGFDLGIFSSPTSRASSIRPVKWVERSERRNDWDRRTAPGNGTAFSAVAPSERPVFAAHRSNIFGSGIAPRPE